MFLPSSIVRRRTILRIDVHEQVGIMNGERIKSNKHGETFLDLGKMELNYGSMCFSIEICIGRIF